MKLLKLPGLKTSCVQLASDGAWEQAVNLADCTGDWIENAGENIAMEVVYLKPSGELAGFIGFRKIISEPKERDAFWRAMTSKRFLPEHNTAVTRMSNWLNDLNLSHILSTPPNFFELGVFNLWQSARTVRQTSENFNLSNILHGPSWLAVALTLITGVFALSGLLPLLLT